MSVTPPERVQLSQLVRTPYIRVLTYPRLSLPAAKSRIRQLEKLGVEELVFEGQTKIGRLGLLGIGSVSVVVRATVSGVERALKVRRMDANRPSMTDEVRLTTLANRIGIGPQVFGHSSDFIVMKLLVSEEFGDWARSLKGDGRRAEIRGMAHAALNQCRKLDIMGLDHGQLSNLRKHLVVAEGAPWIIDFESAHSSSRPKNVTAAAQYLFVGGKVAPFMRRSLGISSAVAPLGALRDYKADLSDFHYSKLLEALKLVSLKRGHV